MEIQQEHILLDFLAKINSQLNMLLPDEECMLEETMCILEGMCPYKQNFNLIRELISSFLQISLEKFMDLKGPKHHCGDLMCQNFQGCIRRSRPLNKEQKAALDMFFAEDDYSPSDDEDLPELLNVD